MSDVEVKLSYIMEGSHLIARLEAAESERDRYKAALEVIAAGIDGLPPADLVAASARDIARRALEKPHG